MSLTTFDQQVIETIKPCFETGPWIAGGAAMSWFNGENVSGLLTDFSILTDVDVFCSSMQQFTEVLDRVKNANCSQESSIHTDNAVTIYFRPNGVSDSLICKLQIIKVRFFESVDQLLENFDFTCCGIATDGLTFKLLPNAAKDLNSRTLNINNYNPETVLNRIFKYWSYGFTPSKELIQKITSDSSIKKYFGGSTDYDAL